MASKYNISAAVDAETYNAIMALAKARGSTRSATIKDLLSQAAPQILKLAQAVEIAKSHIELSDHKLKNHLTGMLDEAVKDIDEMRQTTLKGL